jgi:NADH-quinone oxidoreductase subunit N
VLNAAVAAYYYLRIVAVMYFRTPLATPKAEGGAGPLAAAVAAAVLVVAIGILPRPLAGESNRASPSGHAPHELSTVRRPAKARPGSSLGDTCQRVIRVASSSRP